MTQKSVSKEIQKKVLNGLHMNYLSGRNARIRAQILLENYARHDVNMKVVLNAIDWIIQTGRISGLQEHELNALSGRDWLRFVCDIYANNHATMQDVKDYILHGRS